MRAIGIAALIVFIYAAIHIAIIRGDGSHGVETDFYGCYGPQAEAMLEGELIVDDYRGPLYPAIVAGAGLIGLDLFNASKGLSVIFASLVLVFLYGSMLRLGISERSAVIACSIMAASSVFFLSSVSAGTDMLFCLLCVLCLYFTLGKQWLLCGIAIGLAYLTRVNGILLLIPVLILAERRIPVLIPAIIALMFWGVVTYIDKGTAFYNLNHMNTANVFDPNLDRLVSEGGGSMINLLTVENIGLLVAHSAEVFWGLISKAILLPVVILAAWGLIRKPDKRIVLFMPFLILPLFLVPWVDRYALSVLPFYAVGVAQWLD